LTARSFLREGREVSTGQSIPRVSRMLSASARRTRTSCVICAGRWRSSKAWSKAILAMAVALVGAEFMAGAFPGPDGGVGQEDRDREEGRAIRRHLEYELSAGLGTAFRRAATRIMVEVDVAAFRRVGFLAGNQRSALEGWQSPGRELAQPLQHGSSLARETGFPATIWSETMPIRRVVAGCLLLAAALEAQKLENTGAPMRVSFECSAEEIGAFGLTCPSGHPCPVYLELARWAPPRAGSSSRAICMPRA